MSIEKANEEAMVAVLTALSDTIGTVTRELKPSEVSELIRSYALLMAAIRVQPGEAASLMSNIMGSVH